MPAPCSTTTCSRPKAMGRSSGAASAKTTTTSCSRGSARSNYPKTPTAGTWTCASTARSSTPASDSASSARSRGSAASRTSAKRSRSRARCTNSGPRSRVMTSADAPRLDGQEKSAYWAAGFVVLLAALCGLFYYKWGGAIRTVSGVRALGRWSGTAEGLTTGGVLRESLFYLRRIWIALVYGLLIGAAVRAFVSPRRVADGRFGAVTDDAGPRSARDVAVRFARALGHLTLQTVPLIVAGVLLSSVILPTAVRLSSGAGVVAVLLVAAVGVLVALPTFFEIPLGMLFLGLGAPGAATAILVAGPLVNLPSLLILARETRPRVAVAVALGVWALAVAAGLVAA